MDAPKCRLCGVRDWDHQCDSPVAAKPSPEKVDTKVDTPVVSTPTVVVSTKISAAERVRWWRNENRGRYNAYMRAWRKRAKERAE